MASRPAALTANADRGMHAAMLKSSRLWRVMDLLKDHQEHSTLEIVQRARVCAVNSIVSEHRSHGHDISYTHRGHRWYYQLAPEYAASEASQ